MNNALLHVCISIIQTNHYIYSIILIMNYSPAWSASYRHGCEYKWQVGDFGDLKRRKKTDVFLTFNWTLGWCVSVILKVFIDTHMLKAVFSLFQDKVEEADGGGTRASRGSRKLLRPAEDVPIPVLLPAEPGV